MIYKAQEMPIPTNLYTEYKLVLLDNENTQQELYLNTELHSTFVNEGARRLLALFDALMNHSCDPNSASRQTPEQLAQRKYDQIAVWDIIPGDEITCDYTLFEYDCRGDGAIEKCLCGSANCMGAVMGFKYLSVAEQKARIHLVEDTVLRDMHGDPYNKFYYITDLRCPTDHVKLEPCLPSLDSYKLVACHSFKKGDVIFSNETLVILEGSSIVVVGKDGNRIWLDPTVHTIKNLGNGKQEFLYFDSMLQQQTNLGNSDPNTKAVYHDENHYKLVALKDIAEGDELIR